MDSGIPWKFRSDLAITGPSQLSSGVTSNRLMVRLRTSCGVPLMTAYSHSPLSGWIVAAGIPASTVNAPLWRALGVTTGIGASTACRGRYI